MVLIKDKVVTDGEVVFTNYKWYQKDGKKFIWSCYSDKPLKVIDRNGVESMTLFEEKQEYTKSLEQLRKFSFPEEYTPPIIKNFRDVFGYQNEYCFNPKNPFQIWSKKSMQFIRAASNRNKNSQHFKFNIFVNGVQTSMYVHRMAWESFNNKKLKDGWQVHHLSHDWRDCSKKNLITLPKIVHTIFEKYYGMYKNVNSYYKTKITKEDMIKKINNFAIDKRTKQKLIKSL